jgi:phosphoenolpyruvate-protein kinase (PTS system EI component)
MRKVDNFDDDFGFSLLSEDELKRREDEAAAQAAQYAATKAAEAFKQEFEQEINKTSEYYQGRLKDLYEAIMPLLTNLCKDNDKAYIYWPNRQEKIQRFIDKITKLAEQ